MFIQLKSKTGMFYDPETKLRLRGDEIKEVRHIGYQTRLRMNSGGISMVEAPEVAITEPIIEQAIVEETPMVVIEPVVIEEVKVEPKPRAKRKPNAKKKKTTFSLE
jgi:hypothetical protein